MEILMEVWRMLHAKWLLGQNRADERYIVAIINNFIRPNNLFLSINSKCAERVGIDFGFVTQCVNGGLGQQLQYGAEAATHEIAYPYPKFVPTIVYNRVS